MAETFLSIHDLLCANCRQPSQGPVYGVNPEPPPPLLSICLCWECEQEMKRAPEGGREWFHRLAARIAERRSLLAEKVELERMLTRTSPGSRTPRASLESWLQKVEGKLAALDEETRVRK